MEAGFPSLVSRASLLLSERNVSIGKKNCYITYISFCSCDPKQFRKEKGFGVGRAQESKRRGPGSRMMLKGKRNGNQAIQPVISFVDMLTTHCAIHVFFHFFTRCNLLCRLQFLIFNFGALFCKSELFSLTRGYLGISQRSSLLRFYHKRAHMKVHRKHTLQRVPNLV